MVNGTVLMVKELMPNVIRGGILNGTHAGKSQLIPRMMLCANQTDRKYFPLRRKQFPVRPAFAMTINKSQGQTLQQMSLYLPQPVFAHGQFHVAVSRCWDRKCIKIVGRLEGHEGVYTSNVVYQEALVQY